MLPALPVPALRSNSPSIPMKRSLIPSKKHSEAAVLLDAGSVWLAGEKEIAVFSPFRKRLQLLPAGSRVAVKEIDEPFTNKDAFYFWVSRSIREEFASARTLRAGVEEKLHRFHRGVTRLADHFEREERTLSHMFRMAHPGLGGLSFGERLGEILKQRGCLVADGCVLDIGAGAGFHARDCLARLKKVKCGQGLYVSLDLAPGLLAAQRRMSSTFFRRAFIQANAMSMPFGPCVFDTVIANEVVADFPVERVLKRRAVRHPDIKKYGLSTDDAPGEFLVNTGIFRFLEELRRILKPGGCAVITEYGEEWCYPTKTQLPRHAEYSVHFAHVMTVAKRLGFRVSYDTLFDFLKFSPSVEVITGNSLSQLQRLLRYLGRRLDSFAYTEEMLKSSLGGLLPRIHNLQFLPLSALAAFFRIRDFKVLVLKK